MRPLTALRPLAALPLLAALACGGGSPPAGAMALPASAPSDPAIRVATIPVQELRGDAAFGEALATLQFLFPEAQLRAETSVAASGVVKVAEEALRARPGGAGITELVLLTRDARRPKAEGGRGYARVDEQGVSLELPRSRSEDRVERGRFTADTVPQAQLAPWARSLSRGRDGVQSVVRAANRLHAPPAVLAALAGPLLNDEGVDDESARSLAAALPHATNAIREDVARGLAQGTFGTRLPTSPGARRALLAPLAPYHLTRDRMELVAYVSPPEAAGDLAVQLGQLAEPIRVERGREASLRTRTQIARDVIAALRSRRESDRALAAFLEAAAATPEVQRGALRGLADAGPQSRVGWVPIYQRLYRERRDLRPILLLALTALPEDGLPDPLLDFKTFGPPLDRAGFQQLLTEDGAIPALPRLFPALAPDAFDGDAFLAGVPAFFEGYPRGEGRRSSSMRSDFEALRKVRDALCARKAFRELGILYKGFQDHDKPGENPSWQRAMPELDPRRCVK